MRVIIAGSRSITDDSVIIEAISKAGFEITEVICGGARGVDLLGREWAKKNGIPVKMFSADWNTFGKGAGFIRNTQMAEYADALIAIWDGSSRGTAHMIRTAWRKGILIYVYRRV